jgi:hypothetical protein
MKKLITGGLLSFLFAASVYASGAAAQTKPRRDILGISIGMTADAAREQLKKIGSLDRKERKKQEVWIITNHPKYSGVIIGFYVSPDKAERVRFVTATARATAVRNSNVADATAVRYGDIADTKGAHQRVENKNNYKYSWFLPASGEEPKITVILGGSNDKYVITHTIRGFN